MGPSFSPREKSGRARRRQPEGDLRRLKRLWLETEAVPDRSPYFRNTVSGHWSDKKTISRLDAVT